jgi:glucose uptake protein GlcU
MGLDSTFAIGVVECIASTVLYGSAFVPIKKRKFGDGIYSLQIRSIGILMVGLVTYIIADYPPFYLVAMIGGMLWAIGGVHTFLR